MGMAITGPKTIPVHFCCIGCFRVVSIPTFLHKKQILADEEACEEKRGPVTWFSITSYLTNAQAVNLQMWKAPDFPKATSLIMSYRPLLTALLWKSLSLWVGEAERRRPARPSAAQTLDLLAEE